MNRKNAGLSVGFLYDDTLDSDDAVAQHVKLLGAWLSAAGHSVSYLVGQTKMPSWAGGRVYSLSRNVKVTFNGNRMSVPLFPMRSKIKRILAEQRFDVLHVMAPYSPLMSQQVINLAPESTAVVGTFHIYPSGILSSAGGRLLRPVYGRSLDRITTMISVSRPAADFCRRSLGVSSIIIPNPVDTLAHRSPSLPTGRLKRVVFLGRLVKRKGCEQLIKAFVSLQAEMPSAELVIAGDGPERRKLERLAGKLGIGERTAFLGHIAESEKAKLLASADIACFPSLYGESFGLVLIEAMASGSKTILAGDNPGYRSVLGDQPGCLIDPRDTTAFANRLGQLLTDASLRRKLKNWQQQTVKQYDIGAVGPQVEHVYRAAIARAAKNSHNVKHE